MNYSESRAQAVAEAMRDESGTPRAVMVICACKTWVTMYVSIIEAKRLSHTRICGGCGS